MDLRVVSFPLREEGGGDRSDPKGRGGYPFHMVLEGYPPSRTFAKMTDTV